MAFQPLGIVADFMAELLKSLKESQGVLHDGMAGLGKGHTLGGAFQQNKTDGFF